MVSASGNSGMSADTVSPSTLAAVSSAALLSSSHPASSPHRTCVRACFTLNMLAGSPALSFFWYSISEAYDAMASCTSFTTASSGGAGMPATTVASSKFLAAATLFSFSYSHPEPSPHSCCLGSTAGDVSCAACCSGYWKRACCSGYWRRAPWGYPPKVMTAPSLRRVSCDCFAFAAFSTSGPAVMGSLNGNELLKPSMPSFML
mmetsp:Transcript_37417/g.88483  ORF Transcript_37417/g.88483 Transcript_37417/m.88483 type:complete len:204 (-) Transcript_37417:176-787(-)